MAEKTTVHGMTVSYEDNAEEGIRHLRDDLSSDEARVFFDQARTKGSAQFEDDEDRQYTLIYQNGAYALVRR
ncbi:hypothetical protein C4552_03670 [Candidatus Parcubacteria bacterium]|nr:MAG: hypothetical protein C4552_03670 [Candidatus Parcubacteria bacterium]